MSQLTLDLVPVWHVEFQVLKKQQLLFIFKESNLCLLVLFARLGKNRLLNVRLGCLFVNCHHQLFVFIVDVGQN